MVSIHDSDGTESNRSALITTYGKVDDKLITMRIMIDRLQLIQYVYRPSFILTVSLPNWFSSTIPLSMVERTASDRINSARDLAYSFERSVSTGIWNSDSNKILYAVFY